MILYCRAEIESLIGDSRHTAARAVPINDGGHGKAQTGAAGGHGRKAALAGVRGLGVGVINHEAHHPFFQSEG
jgi:hypothetical protein